jgi:hypothetical protein
VVTIGFLAVIGVVVCGSLFGIAWATGLLDGILLIPPATETAVADTGAVDLGGADTQTPVQVPTDTVESIVDVPTDTPVSTETEVPPTETPTETPLPSDTPLPTATSTPVALFLEDFTGGLDQWETWESRLVNGLIPAQIILGEMLDVKGFFYDRVGATANQPIDLVPGLVIEFEAEVTNPGGWSLYFDWYPGEVRRPTGLIGPLSLEISPTEAELKYIEAGSERDCGIDMDDTEMKLFRIEFGPDWEVAVYYDDGELTEICTVTIDPPANTVGRITFSGWGWVDSIVIMEP